MDNRIYQDIIDNAEDYADKWIDHAHEHKDSELWKAMFEAYKEGAEQERKRVQEHLEPLVKWIREKRPELTGLGAPTTLLKSLMGKL